MTAIIERPILFSGPMVRAILEGRKTQTRRVIKKAPHDDPDWMPEEHCATTSEGWQTSGPSGIWSDQADPGHEPVIKCPFGIPGHQLWVRETHYYDIPLVDMKTKPEKYDPRDMYYRADGECCQQIPECQCFDVGKPKWRPSIFMPRWASRIQLEITDVRVERLNEINGLEAIAEGISRVEGEAPWRTFKHLWDSINAGSHPWDSNPWVWVVEFKLISGDAQ